MKLSQFKFRLPENQVALEPSYHRDECRLMVVHRKSGKIDMTKKDENGVDIKDEEGNPVYLDFRNILDYFDEDDEDEYAEFEEYDGEDQEVEV